MTQFARSTPAAPDYDSSIIGALELVSFPGSSATRGMFWEQATRNWTADD